MAKLINDESQNQLSQETARRALDGVNFTLKKTQRDIVCLKKKAGERAVQNDTTGKGKNIRVISSISEGGLEYTEPRFGSFDGVECNDHHHVFVALEYSMAAEEPDVANAEMPGMVSAVLTSKIGEPYSNGRTSHGSAIPMQLCVTDGYGVFRARVKRKMEDLPEVVWSDTSPIMVKPTQTSSQVKYEELIESDVALAAQLRQIWTRVARRKTGQGAFQLELFVYAQKVGASSVIRRATESRIAPAAARIDEHLAQHPTIPPFGPASRSYWAIQHARQPDSAPIKVPSNTTFNQLRMIDESQRSIDVAAVASSAEPEYVTVRYKLNEGTVPLQLHLGDLRQQLGLPMYPLAPPYRQPVETAPPVSNMEDVDHADSDTENYRM